ncbi:uncharacterized protein LOC130086032 [Rhinichthys klamathensis goyatoka]|uniref:uncharacterized protein LOC130086032 n=1 Tax=Rhinichthys klamathensis goyatoka TaxID=3034132 RepID=UPI0024B5EB5D|nr:uncharacterized protein LOC130086032 [Rhinichthys klamathensis goyatoka]XP_056108114.1 uncharacterized protein LOC130086032 [Rhinichthys klamathensis goyatoka]
MSDSQEIVIASSPGFVTELLPSAQRTALLYHLSYLCLAKFPKLERVLRERAVETQLLFGSSEALLMKCVATSKNLVSTLLPALKVAVEKDKSILAIKSLEKARAWITEIIDKVGLMVDRYEKHNHSVASCTSDVILEKAETERKKAQTTKEIEAQEKAVRDLEDQLKNNSEKIAQIETKISEKNQELYNHVKESSSKSSGLGIFSALVPFVGPIVKSIYNAKTEPEAAAKTQVLSSELTQLSIEKSSLMGKEWNIQVRMTDMQLKLASMKIENGSIPDPVHLNDVQKCLSRIQNILIQLQKCWESVSVQLEALKDETFANEHFIEESEMKEIFLESITSAQGHWKAFGESCLHAKSIFSLQTKDAYKFLETSPSALTPEQWKNEYETVIEELNKINPDPFNPEAPAAITQ